MITVWPSTSNGAIVEFLIKMESSSVVIIKRNGEIGQPCFMPRLIEILGDVPPGKETELLEFSYRDFIIFQNFSPKPNNLKQSKIKGCSIESNAL